MLQRWRQALLDLTLALGLGALAAWALPLDGVARLRHGAQLLRWAPQAPPDGAAVVDIDEASLKRLGPWPMRREAYVPSVRWLLAQGVPTVVLNVLMVDPMPGDEVFGEMAARVGDRLVLAARSTVGNGDAAVYVPPPPGCTATGVEGWLLPRWIHADAGELKPVVGHVELHTDEDGVLRSFGLFTRAESTTLEFLPLAAWSARHPSARLSCESRGGQFVLRAGEMDWPLDARQRIAPWLADPASHLPAVPFWQIDAAARGLLPSTQLQALQATLRARTVFIGSSAAGASDVITLHGPQQGTRVLASIHDALVKDRVLTPPSRARDAGLLAVLALPMLAVALAPRRRFERRPWPWVTVALLMAGLALLGIDALRVARQGVLGDLGWPTCALIVWGVWALVARLADWGDARRRSEAQRQQWETAHKVKSDFVAHVSHELRTPLNALLGAAEMLAQTELSPQQRRYTALFRSAGHDLMHMLNDLLDLSRSDAGLLGVQKVPFSLRRVLDRQVALFEPRASQKGLALRLKLSPALPDTVEGDAQRLAQVLRNLLGNAVKFTDRGEITLHVAPVDGTTIRFEVIDTGIGMAPDALERVFRPYVQTDEGASYRYGGSGLGLAIVSRLTAAMGGRVGVTSRLGEGSNFHVELPLPATGDAPAPSGPTDWAPLATLPGPLREDEARAPVAPSPPAGAAAAARGPLRRWGRATVGLAAAPQPQPFAPPDSQPFGLSEPPPLSITDPSTLPPPWPGTQPQDEPKPASSRRRVLAVDDSTHNLALMQAFLEGSGWRLDVAQDGHRGLQRSAERAYDAILLDLNMPGLSGLDVARSIRRAEAERGGPRRWLVAVTGNVDLADRAAARAAGFDGHLGKPFSRQQLFAALDAAPLAMPAAAAPQARVEDVPPARSWPPVDLDLGLDSNLDLNLDLGLDDLRGAPPAPSHAAAASALALALQSLPETDVPTAIDRLGSSTLFDQVADAMRRPLRDFESSLDAALAARPIDLDTAQRLLHDLKTMAATLGQTGLSTEAEQLERLLQGEGLAGDAEVAVRWQRLRRSLSQRLGAVRAVLDALQPSDADR